jgi:hypothetical protein
MLNRYEGMFYCRKDTALFDKWRWYIPVLRSKKALYQFHFAVTNLYYFPFFFCRSAVQHMLFCLRYEFPVHWSFHNQDNRHFSPAILFHAEAMLPSEKHVIDKISFFMRKAATPGFILCKINKETFRVVVPLHIFGLFS